MKLLQIGIGFIALVLFVRAEAITPLPTTQSWMLGATIAAIGMPWLSAVLIVRLVDLARSVRRRVLLGLGEVRRLRKAH